MSREDVRATMASWEAYSAEYQELHRPDLNRWDVLAWGASNIPEDQLRALGDVSGLDALEFGCGACQFGIKVAMRGANVTGLDFSANQLAAAGPNFEESGVRFPVVRASAEEVPFADSSFDLVFCDHGAMTFADPHSTVPEASRVLRPGGHLIFNMATPIISMCWPPEEGPPGRTLLRPYFGLGRTSSANDPAVEWQLTYGSWVNLFRENGFAIEQLIELRPPPDADTTYTDYAPLDWARDFPGEHIWKVRKERA